MNPFDLAGPQFLVFYLFLSMIVVLFATMARWMKEYPKTEAPRMSDPYQIAYLRAGKDEALRVAVASLLDRKLLLLNSTSSILPEITDQLETADPASINQVRRQVERSILERFTIPGSVEGLTRDIVLEAATLQYKKELTQLGLLPDEKAMRRRNLLANTATLVLIGTAVTKIGVALSRGRTNIAVLILMSVAAVFLLRRLVHTRRTRAGDEVLSDLKELFAGLKRRAASLVPGGESNELAFLAGIYGFEVVPPAIFPFAPALRPRQSNSCGSSFGGSSCGSSCGGGCGGGCGGCGS